MKLFTFGIIASLVYFNATTGALTKMTQADCNAGIQAACEQLKKWALNIYAALQSLWNPSVKVWKNLKDLNTFLKAKLLNI